jgi:hypothetical protein
VPDRMVALDSLYAAYERWTIKSALPLIIRDDFESSICRKFEYVPRGVAAPLIKGLSLKLTDKGHEPTDVEAEPLLTLTNRMLTCAACDRVMEADDGDTLPQHWLGRSQLGIAMICPGSYTTGHPHRPIEEIKPLKIEMVEENVQSPRPVEAISDAVLFLNRWLGELGMPLDSHSLLRLITHAAKIQSSAVHLLDYGRGSQSSVASIARMSSRNLRRS